MECTHSHISPPVPALSLLHYRRFTTPLAARRAHHSRSCRHWLVPLQTWVASRTRSPACDSPSSPTLLPTSAPHPRPFSPRSGEKGEHSADQRGPLSRL